MSTRRLIRREVFDYPSRDVTHVAILRQPCLRSACGTLIVFMHLKFTTIEVFRGLQTERLSVASCLTDDKKTHSLSSKAHANIFHENGIWITIFFCLSCKRARLWIMQTRFMLNQQNILEDQQPNWRHAIPRCVHFWIYRFNSLE